MGAIPAQELTARVFGSTDLSTLDTVIESVLDLSANGTKISRVKLTIPPLMSMDGYQQEIDINHDGGYTLFTMIYETYLGVRCSGDYTGKPVKAFYENKMLKGLQPIVPLLPVAQK